MPQQGEDLSGRDLSGSDFSGATLRYVDFSRADLSDADLGGADLRYADLSDADLSGADLSGADLEHATLVGSDLTDATLSGTQLGHATFEAGGDSEGSGDSAEEDLSSAVGSVIVWGTLALGITLLLAGWSNFWMVFVIGFAVVLPLAGTLAGWYEERTAEAEPEPKSDDADERPDPLADLRRRYADGEIDDAEFERRVERLLETESMTDAELAYGEGASKPGSESESASESKPDSGSESGSESEPESTAADPQLEREVE
ncbi:pentapeptide repeat-containing protein [Halosimplex salinum]|uniref:pentapeptide repeat-containing protein n=1 Tax=Halosimplex salinum TaxID=1710538 RepID=UPI0019D2C1E8|nr:pentapeptide repeat-containing protein [Halosimplex salinum]